MISIYIIIESIITTTTLSVLSEVFVCWFNKKIIWEWRHRSHCFQTSAENWFVNVFVIVVIVVVDVVNYLIKIVTINILL